jgi:hypothetical protein
VSAVLEIGGDVVSTDEDGEGVADETRATMANSVI